MDCCSHNDGQMICEYLRISAHLSQQRNKCRARMTAVQVDQALVNTTLSLKIGFQVRVGDCIL